MFEHFRLVADKGQAPVRVDKFIATHQEDTSRNRVQQAIKLGYVLVNDKPAKANTVIRPCDVIKFVMPYERRGVEILPEDIPLDIVYEDDDLIVVNKPKGMVVHPAAGNLSGTLVNALLFHCGSLSAINGVERPGIVHRIDKDTSGLLVAAKSDAAHRGLSAQFAEHSITRLYRGVCFFGLSEDRITIDAPIGRDPKNRLRNAVVPDGRHAVTHIKVLKRYKGFTEFSAKLETGRTHQIRVHMAHINRPLLGDELYGPARQPYKTEGQMLHAGTLGFVHPVTGQYMEFSAQPPAEYMNVLQKLPE